MPEKPAEKLVDEPADMLEADPGTRFEDPRPREAEAAASGGGRNSVRVSQALHEGHLPAHLENESPHSLQANRGFLAVLEDVLAISGI
jgi:hypothetical protein